MRGATRTILLILLILAPATAEEPVAVVRLNWETGALAGALARKVPLADAVPSDVRPAPDAKDARYGRVDLANGKRMAVALGGQRFWFDRNLDGNLGDETPVKVPEAGKAWDHEPTVRAGDREIALRFYLGGNCKHDHVHFVSMTHLRGEVVLAGRLRTVAIDAGGRLLLDFDGDGALNATAESVADGDAFRLQGLVFEVRVTGDVVEFHRSEAEPTPRAAAWMPLRLNAYGLAKKEPGVSLDALLSRYREEAGLAYAQRLPTLRAIAAIHDAQGFESLFDIARDGTEDSNLRNEAVRAMGQQEFKPFGRRVAWIAASPRDPQRAEIACQVLHLIDYPERERVYMKVLDGRTSIVVRGAAAGLVLLGKPEAVERLVREGTAPNVRAYAYYGLRFGQQPPPAELVREALVHGNPLLRTYALPDLYRVNPEQARLRALDSVEVARQNLSVADQVADILGRAGDAEAVRALFTLVAGAHPNLLDRIRRSLSPVRDAGATAEYINALGSEDAAMRTLAASLLADLPGRKTTDALMRRVKREKDPAVMQALLEALGEHGDPKSVSTLLRLAKNKNPATRIPAMQALARLGPGISQVRSFFLRLLSSQRWEDRVYALDVAGEGGNPDLAAMILKNLTHKQWQVRHAAVEALGKLRVREAVLPLIKRLELEDVKRVRAAIAYALFVTTGMNLYDFTETWKKWWLEHGNGFEVPAEIPQRKKVDSGGTVASFYGLPLDSDRVTFVIDQSGSMNASDGAEGSRLDTAVSETLGAVGRLKAQDRINVILFESGIHPWQKKLVPLSASNRADLESHLRRRKPAGSTNLYDALELALTDKQVDTIFVLSDGSPTSGKYVAMPDILRAVRRLNQARRIAIHCVSVGMDSTLLKKLAAANAGQYVRR